MADTPGYHPGMLQVLLAQHPSRLKPYVSLQKNQLIAGAFVGVANGVCDGGRDLRAPGFCKFLVGDEHTQNR